MAGAFRLNLRCRTRLLLLAAGCTLGSVPVLAGEWEQSISLPATIEHDTNLPLATTNKQGVSRLIVVPAYSLVGTYGLDELKAGLGLRVERSSDQRISIDREDPNLLFGWRRQTETGEFGLTATYQEVSSRAAELENTGGIAPDSTQKTGSLKGLWRSAVTERSTLSTDADYKMVSYDGGTQTDYKNLVAGISWNYTWSERIEPFLRFSASQNHGVCGQVGLLCGHCGRKGQGLRTPRVDSARRTGPGFRPHYGYRLARQLRYEVSGRPLRCRVQHGSFGDNQRRWRLCCVRSGREYFWLHHR
jgi:hypothetical protein